MDTNEYKKVLDDWRSRIVPFQEATGKEATRLQNLHFRIGVPAVILTTLASTAIFAQAQSQIVVPIVSYVAGTVAAIGAILSGLITFMSHLKRAEKHRSIAAQLVNLRHTIDIEISFPPSSPDAMRKKLYEINKVLSDISINAPTVSFPKGELPPKESDSGGGGVTVMLTTEN